MAARVQILMTAGSLCRVESSQPGNPDAAAILCGILYGISIDADSTQVYGLRRR
jgi:hypothetical protein